MITLTDSANRAIDNLVAFPRDARPTVDRETLRNILLCTDGWLSVGGKMYDVRSEHLGANIYRLRLEIRNGPF